MTWKELSLVFGIIAMIAGGVWAMSAKVSAHEKDVARNSLRLDMFEANILEIKVDLKEIREMLREIASR